MYDFIRSLTGGWARLSDNVWIIKTYSSAVDIRDQIRRIVPAETHVFVLDVNKSMWATSNFDSEIVSWIKSNL